MKFETNHCDDRDLSDLLDRDDDASPSELWRHLGECDECRSRLTELAGEAGYWRIQSLMLQPVQDDEPESDAPTRFCVTGHGAWGRSRWDEAAVRRLLNEPSHPEMLGRLGRYEIERVIGAGGMGIVVKGHDTELNRPVAIKLLAPHLAAVGAARQRFSREARAAAAVVHEHVVPIHDVQSDDASPYLVMQFVSGESLQSRLDRTGPLELVEILRIGMQAASGLAAAHSHGLVHRDVKPANILLEEGVERAYLSDFGLARAVDDASITHTGVLAGTPQYMSPEQVRGGKVDVRSDLFALGSVLYSMCAGRPPFRGDNSYAILRAITDGDPPALCEVNPRVPAWLERLVARLMSKAPESRYANADEVAALLRQCLAHVQQPSSVELPEELRPVANSTGRGMPKTAAWGLAALAVVVLLGAFAVLGRDASWPTGFGIFKRRAPGAGDRNAAAPAGAGRPAADAAIPDFLSRVASPITRPVMADSAPVLACIGPPTPLALGAVVTHADIARGGDPTVVHLHVWDWSISPLSRVLFVQRSELGALAPDGSSMLTQDGESLDLKTKQTRQFSGFQVPEGRRIVSVHLSPTKQYAAALIHVKTQIDRLATDPPALDARHFWALRIIKLVPAQNRGVIVGEYPADARAGIVFTPDESTIVHAAEEHGIVRRDLATGKLLNEYQPAFGARGAIALAASPDGGWIAAAGYDGELIVWETETGKRQVERLMRRVGDETDAFFQARVLRFSPGGKFLAMASGRRLKVVESETGRVARDYRDAVGCAFVHLQWAPDGEVIRLLTSSEPTNVATPQGASAPADRLPQPYEWNWRHGAPRPANVARPPLGESDVAAREHARRLESRRFEGDWKIVSRSTAGEEQAGEFGKGGRMVVRDSRMGEVRLRVDPTRRPHAIDLEFVAGPDKGKVLRGIYEWITAEGTVESTDGAFNRLRISTFTEPHPDAPDERPRDFVPSKNVDTAEWERANDEPTDAPAKPVISNQE